MPSLRDILQDTFVQIAAKNGGTIRELEGGAVAKPARGAPSPTGPRDQSIWYWEHKPRGDDLSYLEPVECWSRSMGEMHPAMPSHGWMTVCDYIRLGLKGGLGGEHGVFAVGENFRTAMPLTRPFLWKSFVVEGGKNPGAAGDPETWWPLPADVDSGLLLVFVYDLANAKALAKPWPKDDPDFADNPTLMPEADAGDAMATAGSVPVASKGTGVVGGRDYSRDHFVVVCASLVCTKERPDFEPGAIVGMARMVPHLQVMTSKPVKRVETQVSWGRPSRSGYWGDFENPDGPRVMAHADMDVNMNSLLVTDTNAFRAVDQSGLVNMPYWDLIFDYVLADVETKQVDSLGTVWALDKPTMVVDRNQPARKISSAIAVLDYDRLGNTVRKVIGTLALPTFLAKISPFLGGAVGMQPVPVGFGMSVAVDALLSRPSLRLATTDSTVSEILFGGNLAMKEFLPRKPVTFTKNARQGSFDSIHQAPRMKADKLLAMTKYAYGNDYQLDSIRMAPFCEHDCLHTHWRWGSNWDDIRIKPLRNNVQSLRGFTAGGSGRFGGVGKPYAGPIGAPMVPVNQEVSLTLPSRRVAAYDVVMREPKSGVWQIANHHGSGYAVSIVQKAMVDGVAAVIAGPTQKLPPKGEIAELYWNMRFQGANDGKLERLEIRDLRQCMDG